MSENPTFTIDDFIYENNYGDAVRLVAKRSADVANAKVAPVFERFYEKTIYYTGENARLANRNRVLQEENARLRAALVDIVNANGSPSDEDFVTTTAREALEAR